MFCLYYDNHNKKIRSGENAGFGLGYGCVIRYHNADGNLNAESAAKPDMENFGGGFSVGHPHFYLLEGVVV